MKGKAWDRFWFALVIIMLVCMLLGGGTDEFRADRWARGSLDFLLAIFIAWDYLTKWRHWAK